MYNFNVIEVNILYFVICKHIYSTTLNVAHFILISFVDLEKIKTLV